MVVYTIGHSNRDAETFLALLQAHGVQVVVDVRRFPGSRKHPQFGGEALAANLAAHGIHYRHAEDLGGRRRSPSGATANDAWRNPSFRAYADYMQTAAFEAALDALLTLAAERTACLMCSEAVPWRCHRGLIADALLVRGVTVLDIYTPSRATPHKLTPFARVQGHQLTYPA
jgi:uncharacterized protein (DUF488 family)